MPLNAGNSGAFRNGAAITPSDSVNLTDICRAIYVGGAGNIVVVWTDDTTSTFVAVPVGTTLYVAAKRINLSSTTATNLLALY